jgi:hypothetical protein
MIGLYGKATAKFNFTCREKPDASTNFHGDWQEMVDHVGATVVVALNWLRAPV